MTTPKKWLVISCNETPGFVEMIDGKMDAKKIDRTPLIEYGMSLSQKLLIIKELGKHLTETKKSIIDDATKSYTENNVCTPQKPKQFAVNLNQPELMENSLIFIHSFLFECGSMFELLKKFIDAFYNKCLKELKNKVEVYSIIENNDTNHDMKWINKLASHRNHFIHESCSYIAIDISSETEPDILISRRNLTTFSKEKEFIRWSELLSIAEGLDNLMIKIQEHLINSLEQRQ